jgi:hypothetical protein
MHVAGRGVAVHAREMLGDERLNVCRGKVILTDGDSDDAFSCAA